MLTMIFPSVSAQSAVPQGGSIDTGTFDQILEPVWNIYNLIKYVSTAIALIVLLFAGIMFMSSGNDTGKRETAKNMIAFVVVGLIVIWAAPFIVQLVAL